VMWGDSDQLTPPDANQEIADLLPHAQRVELAQCGHMLTMEQPDQVNAHLLRWLEALPAQAG
jgi:pimeloyl-ACP methyl ester carboxylesterase